MSVCFAFQCGMRALCGTGGHFPTEESISFKARGPTVTAVLIVTKYYRCREEGKKRLPRMKIKYTLAA